MPAPKEKIDTSSAFIARVHIPAEDTAVDGFLPAEDLDMVIAKGAGRFEGKLMVQMGSTEGKTAIGIVYRPGPEYIGSTQGRERYIDPNALKNGTVVTTLSRRGIWVPIELLGTIH